MAKLNEIQRVQVSVFALFAAGMTVAHVASVLTCPPWGNGEGFAVFMLGAAAAVVPGLIMARFVGWLNREVA